MVRPGISGRPVAQWVRLATGYGDELDEVGSRTTAATEPRCRKYQMLSTLGM